MTSVKYDYSFITGVYTGDELKMNNYTLLTHIYIETSDPVEQQLAFDRMSLMIYDIVENSIFIEESDHENIIKYNAADFNVITFSDPGPIDQVVLVTIIDKLNAITEGRLNIFESEISSLRGGYVKYIYQCNIHTKLDTLNEALISNNLSKWWNDAAPRFISGEELGDIINMPTVPTWDDFELGWPTDSNKTTGSNIIPMIFPTK